MRQENIDVVRALFEAFNRGDRATVGALLAPDVEWLTVAGPLLGVDKIRGREAMLKFIWEDIPEVIDGYRSSSEEFTDLDNDQVLVVSRYQGRGRSSDAEVSLRVASVYEIRDGMVSTVRDFDSREEVLESVSR